MLSRSLRFASALSAAAIVSLAAGQAAAQDCTPPKILFVVDASSSMLNDIGGETKWDAAQDAIDAVLTAYPAQADYGLMTFPGSGGGCSLGEIDVEVASGTGASILSTLANRTIPAGAQTPAGQTLVTAADYAGITDGNFANYVIFVTDGYQYCSVNGDSACATQADCTLMGVGSCPTCLPDANDGCYCVQDWTILGAEALATAGVKTYVVGFGAAVNVSALNKTADAGGTGQPGCDPEADVASCYYQASDPAELTAALGGIVQQVVTETCDGDCGIEGTRTCEPTGWGECIIPDTVPCESTCQTAGTQSCVNGSLTECSSEADCGGTGGAGPASSSSSAATGGSGGAPATSGVGGSTVAPQNVNQETECGCRVVGRRAPRRSSAGWLALLGLAAIARRRRR